MPWIRTVGEAEATGLLKQEYEKAVKRAGRIYNILKVMSLSPLSLQASMGLYGAAMFGRSLLSRSQREMLATVVSAANHCVY